MERVGLNKIVWDLMKKASKSTILQEDLDLREEYCKIIIDFFNTIAGDIFSMHTNEDGTFYQCINCSAMGEEPFTECGICGLKSKGVKD